MEALIYLRKNILLSSILLIICSSCDKESCAFGVNAVVEESDCLYLRLEDGTKLNPALELEQYELGTVLNIQYSIVSVSEDHCDVDHIVTIRCLKEQD